MLGGEQVAVVLLFIIFIQREKRPGAAFVLCVDSFSFHVSTLFRLGRKRVSSAGNWKDPEPQWRLVKKRGGDWMTVQDVTHEIMTTTLNFKQMVNVLNLNI